MLWLLDSQVMAKVQRLLDESASVFIVLQTANKQIPDSCRGVDFVVDPRFNGLDYSLHDLFCGFDG
jgi:hypothetical protein